MAPAWRGVHGIARCHARRAESLGGWPLLGVRGGTPLNRTPAHAGAFDSKVQRAGDARARDDPPPSTRKTATRAFRRCACVCRLSAAALLCSTRAPFCWVI